MSNKAVSLKFFETYADRHDSRRVLALFGESAMIHATAVLAPMDVRAYQQLGQAFSAGFPDIAEG